MTRYRLLSFAALLGGLVLALPIMAQDAPYNPEPLASLTGSYSFSGGPSVVGSDGTIYETTSYYTFSFFGSKGDTKDSKLRSYKPDSTKSDADGSLTFTGYATHLGIGKGDQLFLVVGSFSYSSKSSTNGSTLYLVKKDLLTAAAGARVEAIAQDTRMVSNASLTAAIKVELKGYVISLKVKETGSKEYIYLHTSEYQLSPFTITNKLVIVDSSSGKIVRESTLD